MNRKILVVYHFFAHYRKGIIEEMLKNESFDFYFTGGTTDPSSGGVKEYKFTSNRFTPIKTKYVYGSFLIQQGLLRQVWEGNYKAIIFLGDSQFITTWAAALIARIRGTKVLFWTIGWMRPENGVKSIYRTLFYRLSNTLLLYGDYAKEIALSKGFSNEKLYVIYNSLDYEYQSSLIKKYPQTQLRKELFKNSDAPIVICISRLVKKRKIELIIEALSILGRQGKAVNLLLVGEGEAKEHLATLSENLGVTTTFYGACYDESVIADLYSVSTVTVAPGMVGLTAMQSLTYGVPVITHGDKNSQAPEWEAIEDGVTGAFFRLNDVHDLATKIDAWTTRATVDQSVAQLCREVISKRYNPQYQMKVIEEAINR